MCLWWTYVVSVAHPSMYMETMHQLSKTATVSLRNALGPVSEVEGCVFKTTQLYVDYFCRQTPIYSANCIITTLSHLAVVITGIKHQLIWQSTNGFYRGY